MGAPHARVQLEGQTLHLEWPGVAACVRLAAGCRLIDGSEHSGAAWTCVPGAEGRYRTSCGPLQVELELQPSDGCVRMRLEAIAGAPVDVTQMTVSARAELAGQDLAWVIYNGYHSWDRSGLAGSDGQPRESWWTVGLAGSDGSGIAAAATAARDCCTKFELAGGVFTTAWREAETFIRWPTLFMGEEGTRWRSEEVLLSAGRDVREQLAAILRPSRRTGPVRVGWLSWYHHGPWVTREDILAHADILAGDPYRSLGYRLVQLDDGWQMAYGDWKPNTKFPGGIRSLCDEIAGRGQVAGIWTAPFLVSASADLAAEAPESWFLVDPTSGERAVDERHRAFGPMYVLDASQPGVQAHLRDVFAELYDAGIRYFKIDFLYAGGYAGTRALRAGLEAIREGAGDAQVLACGAPLLPVRGLAEGCRIGPDTATPLFDFETGLSQPTVFGDEVVAVGRNQATRYSLARWFQLDADVALVGGNLSLDQARQLVTIAVLSGGPFFASDDLRRLPPERLALLTNPEVLPLVGGGPAVPDWEPGASDLPATHWRQDDVLAIFNWTAADREVAVNAPGARHARDLWSHEELDGFSDGTTVTVPASGVRLVRLFY